MNSLSEEQYWVFCPFCHQPNKYGKHFCSRCWSPRIRTAMAVTTQEMQQLLKQYEALEKRRYTIKFATIAFVLLALILGLSLLFLVNHTDILIKPAQFINSSSHPGEWAMFRHDLSYSGTTGATDVLPDGEIMWTFQTNAAIESSPAIANGIVYVGSRDSNLYAIDASTGSKKWAFRAGSWVESSPVIVNGVLYFGSNDGNLYALNAVDGRQLWFFKTPYPVKSAPAVADDVVYFGADDSYLYALDAETGEKLWEFKATAWVDSPPVINNGIVYISSGSSLFALDARSGRKRLDFHSYYLISSAPAIGNSTVFFGNSMGILYAIDGNARNWPLEHELKPYWMNLWLFRFPVPQPKPQSGSIWGVKLGNAIHSSPAVFNDTVYTGVDNKVMAIDIEKGETLWSFETNDTVKSSPIVVNNTIYFGNDNGRLYALDATTGKNLWDISTGGPIVSSPALSDGTLYISSHDGKLYAIR